ncbi:ABC transporter substrate-binding protein [Paracoccus denitrificans]|uniref:ABC transporter substrate-binding protein n=1 Tax=Paracoccus denitrificans TaxID=266 RepID=UPI000CEC27CE|nr:ABC transporter substrate-binding protein [Paracoccus denitrificans]
MLFRLILMLALFVPALARAELRLTDAVGREVVLPGPARKIVTNDSLLLLSLALLEDDPVAPLLGWGGDNRVDAGLRAAFRARFPGIDAVPEISGVVPRSTSAEPIIAVAPDLYVVTLWDSGWLPLVDKLQAAGIPVLFLEDPADHRIGRIESSARALRLLGQAMGSEARARAYADFADRRLHAIAARIGPDTARPRVLIDAHASGECCAIPGRNNMLAQMVALAGGESYGSAAVPGYDGRVALEPLIADPPAIWIGTGGAHLAGSGGLVLGTGIEPAAAQASLRRVLDGTMRRLIPPVAEGRSHAVSHQLAISALNLVVTECFARWIHPELFGALDPRETMARIDAEFLAVPLTGSFCIDAKE